MKLHSNDSGITYRVTAYGPGYFMVNDTRIESSIILCPDQVIAEWPPADISELDPTALEPFDGIAPEVLLIGTGRKHAFPEPDLLGPLTARGIGVEVMSTDAACRTYNILLAEDRRVAAGLIRIAPERRS